MGLRRGSAQTLCLACTFPVSFLGLPRAQGRMKPSGPWSDEPSYMEVQSGTPGRGAWMQAHCFTCSLPGHICIVKAVGGQCLTGENVAQTVAFQVLLCRAESPGKVFSSLCHVNSVGLWTSSSSVLCFADKEPEGQRDQGCPPVGGRAGAPRSPNSLLTRESASLWGQPAQLPDTPHPHCQPQVHPRDQSQESWPLASSGQGVEAGPGMQRSFPSTWLNSAPRAGPGSVREAGQVRSAETACQADRL